MKKQPPGKIIPLGSRPPRRVLVSLLEESGIKVITDKEGGEAIVIEVREGPAHIAPRPGIA